MKTAKQFGKRGLAVLLALIMCVGMLNLTAFAASLSSLFKSDGPIYIQEWDISDPNQPGDYWYWWITKYSYGSSVKSRVPADVYENVYAKYEGATIPNRAGTSMYTEGHFVARAKAGNNYTFFDNRQSFSANPGAEVEMPISLWNKNTGYSYVWPDTFLYSIEWIKGEEYIEGGREGIKFCYIGSKVSGGSTFNSPGVRLTLKEDAGSNEIQIGFRMMYHYSSLYWNSSLGYFTNSWFGDEYIYTINGSTGGNSGNSGNTGDSDSTDADTVHHVYMPAGTSTTISLYKPFYNASGTWANPKFTRSGNYSIKSYNITENGDSSVATAGTITRSGSNSTGHTLTVPITSSTDAEVGAQTSISVNYAYSADYRSVTETIVVHIIGQREIELNDSSAVSVPVYSGSGTFSKIKAPSSNTVATISSVTSSGYKATLKTSATAGQSDTSEYQYLYANEKLDGYLVDGDYYELPPGKTNVEKITHMEQVVYVDVTKFTVPADDEPTAPDAPTEKKLQDDDAFKVTVACIGTNKSSHPGSTKTASTGYSIKTGTITDITRVDDTTYTLTVNSAKYVEKFDESRGATHTPAEATQTVTVTYNESTGKWSASNARFEVTCDEAIAAPTYDDLKALIGVQIGDSNFNDGIYCCHTTMNVGLRENSYELTGSGSSYTVTVLPAKYLAEYDIYTGVEGHYVTNQKNNPVQVEYVNGKWQHTDTSTTRETTVVFEVNHDAPTTPAAPSNADVENMFTLHLYDFNDRPHGAQDYHPLTEGTYTISEVTKEGDSYVCTVTIETAKYLEKYIEAAGGVNHVLVNDSNATLTEKLVYNGQWLSKDGASTINKSVAVKCDTTGGENPGGGDGDGCQCGGDSAKCKCGDSCNCKDCDHNNGGTETQKPEYKITVNKKVVGDTTVTSGATVNYMIEITNASTPTDDNNATLYGLWVEDTMSSGMVLNSSVTYTFGNETGTMGSQQVGNHYTWTFPSSLNLAVGETVTLTYSVKVTNPVNQDVTLTNTADAYAYKTNRTAAASMPLTISAKTPFVAIAADDADDDDIVHGSSGSNGSGSGNGGNSAGVTVKHEHKYQVTETVEPTCTEGGKTTYTCSECHETKTETTSATGHAYPDTWTDDGNDHIRVCANDSSHVERAAHSYGDGDWIVRTEATYEAAGEEYRACEDCGHEETRVIPKLIPDHTHSYTSSVTKEATCTETGETTYTCECGESYTETIPVLGHNYPETWTDDEEHGDHYHACTRCGNMERAAHSYGAWTVRTPATLEAAGLEYRTCGACGHEETREIKQLSPETSSDVYYTLVYNMNNGTGMTTSTTQANNPSFTINSTEPTRDGYTFQGWATSADGAAEYQAGSRITISGTSQVLYAVWSEVTEIPEEDPPLSDTPDVEIPEEDPPLSDTPDVEIPEEDPPLSDTPDVEIPEEDPPLSDLPELDIPDGDVPLAGVPDTGDYSHIWAIVTLISGMGLAVLVLTNKKREEIAE